MTKKQTTTKAVTKRKKAQAPQKISNDQKSDLFDPKENLSGIDVRLPQIGIIHQGQLFLMPDGSKRESFKGHILDISRANAYWITPFSESGGGVPPDCFSVDGINPNHSSSELQADSCSESKCSMNVFGSDPGGGRSKACKNMRRVHIVIEDYLMPFRLSAPPSSITPVEMYASTIQGSGCPYQLVVTEFSLKESSNKDGIKYSELVLTKVSDVDQFEEASRIKKLHLQWLSVMREQYVTSDEYTEEG